MFLMFDTTYGYVMEYRRLWFDGRYGSNKTLISFAICKKLYEDGLVDRIISNCPSVWNEDFPLVVSDPYNARVAILFDEAGLYLKTRQDADDVIAFLRKMDIYLIAPSVNAPHPNLQNPSTALRFSFAGFGLPLFAYQTILAQRARKITDTWFFWNPAQYYGIYDTLAAPTHAKHLLNLLSGLKDRIADSDDDDQEAIAFREAVNPLQEVVTDFEHSVYQLEQQILPTYGKGKRNGR